MTNGAPWLCAAGKTLREQVNLRFQGRDKRSDGWVADAAHAARKSDHNADETSTPPGCVRAVDLDEDVWGPTRPDPHEANLLAAELVWIGAFDARLSYLIFEGVIWSRVRGWRPRKYTGANAHEHHIHVSFTPSGDHDGAPFDVPILHVGSRIQGST